MRWAIEVYFKEAKQHLGFLKEQSNHDGNETIYVDFKSIRKIGNNKVELWYLLEFKKTEQSVDYSYLSSVVQDEFDCDKKIIRMKA